jgi:hypothetical protein
VILRITGRHALVVALVVACGLVAAPPLARDTLAAAPDLTIVGDARYDVQPANHRIRITVDLVATNHLVDTATKRFYFDRAFLQVQPGTTNYRLTSSSGSPSVRVSRRLTGSTILQLTFGRRLFSGQTARFQLRFDLPDAGGAPARDVRVGTSLVTFPAWGFGTAETPAGTVSVTFPAGYTIDVFAGPFNAPTTATSGAVTYASGKLDDASRFSAFFVADRPATYVERSASTKVRGATVQFKVRSWSDDPAWGRRVTSLFERGLPVTAQLVGLPWSLPAPLVVQEGVSRTTGGYAGLFDPTTGHIEVAYYAGSFVVLHEAAHSWFNGALLQDRWANEAFASYYAVQVARQLGEKVTAEPLTDELRKSRIALNDWGGVGTEQAAAEDYAYAASLTLANSIAQRAGPGGLKAVWVAAGKLQAAYQPADGQTTAASAERSLAPPDWRALLDLLEDGTGKRFDDLWRTWVVRDDEKALLDARATARTAYAELVTEAGTWQLPGAIRAAMRAWRFDEARQLMAGAQSVLDRRAELDAAAADAGVRLPNRMEEAFETADGVSAANAEADAELVTLRAIATASTARPIDQSPLTQLGLLGQAPEQQLADARAAFERGDIEAAGRDAAAARSAWADASVAGMNRLLAAAAAVLLVLLVLAVLAARRSRPRARSAPRRDPFF